MLGVQGHARDSCPALYVSLLSVTPCSSLVLLAGLRALHADWHSSPAAGGQRDGPCVHVCHTEAAAHDHQ